MIGLFNDKAGLLKKPALKICRKIQISCSIASGLPGLPKMNGQAQKPFHN
jgi:hypothetical protein